MKKEKIFVAKEKKNGEGKGGKCLEKENILCGVKEIFLFFRRRRKHEKEKKERGGNIWRWKEYFCGGEKNGEGKGGQYLEKESMFLQRRGETIKENDEEKP